MTHVGLHTRAALMDRQARVDARYGLTDEVKPLGMRLHAIHHELCRSALLEPLQRIAIAIYDSSNDLVETFAESEIKLNAGGRYEMHLADMGALRQVANDRVTRIIDAIGPDASGRLGALHALGFRSSMTVPVYNQGTLFGFIFFDATRPAFFDEAMADRLSPYAQLIALLLIHEMMTVRLVRAVVKTAQEMTRQHDYETATHLERMSYYTRLIAREGASSWGFSDEFVEHLFWYARLHDIGKVAIPDRILLKPGRLTEEEMGEVRLHVVKGVEIIDAIIGEFGLDTIPFIKVARNIIAFHHENIDGSGYPAQAAGNDIPIEGRIIAVADVFDALTNVRPYKPCWSNEDALAHLRRQVGRKFDGDCVEALARRMDEVVLIQQRFQTDIAP